MTSLNLKLLERKVPMPDLTIGQAMEIAKIPQMKNEKRISAFINNLTGESDIAEHLTIQERYYMLINHLSIADNKYVEDVDYSRYYLATEASQIPKSTNISGIEISHLYGRHAELLEHQCENVFDWISGAMACQLSGNIGGLIDDQPKDDDNPWQWEKLDPQKLETMSDEALNSVVLERFNLISGLNEYQYNLLVDIFYSAEDNLSHFVEVSFDNNGIAIIDQSTEEGAGKTPVRFPSLTHLRGVAKELAECII